MSEPWHKYKPASCAECTLYNEPGPCFGDGPPSRAKLIYISEKPGVDEIRSRPMRPFMGGAGNVLNRQLFEAGVKRSDLVITNVVKCMPPGGREPTEHEIACCRPLLDEELKRCKADTVLLAGAVAFNAMIGDYSTLSPDYHPSTSIFERLGCVEQKDGRKWIPTIHPAHLMRFSDTPLKTEAVHHIRKAWAISGVKVPLPVVIENPTHADVERHKKAARATGIFSDDCEAFNRPDLDDEDYYGSDNWMMDITGFSAVEYEAFVLPRERCSEWNDIWSDESLIQCEHNGESDRFYLEQVCKQRNKRFDTMYAHHMLNNNVHKFLKPECVRLYTNLPYYNRDLENQVGRKFYNGMDCIATLLAAKEQIRQMKADVYIDHWGTEGEKGKQYPGRLYDLYWGHAFPGEPGLGRILELNEEQRRVGINVNMRMVLLMIKWLGWRLERTQQEISELIGLNFNWRSYGPGGDVQTLFYQRWKLPVQYKKDPKTRRMKVTCDDAARKKMAEWIEQKPERKEQYAEAYRYFKLVNEAGSAATLLTFSNRISPEDNRIHPMMKAHGTANFRIASTPNIQNWPDWPILRRCRICGKTAAGGKLLGSLECCGEEMGAGAPCMRAMVVPDNPEDLLLAVDFDQCELWTYSFQFGIKYLNDIHDKGEYLYGVVYEDVVGKKFFNPTGPRTKKNMLPELTYGSLREAKAVPLGFQGGMEGELMAQRQNWPLEKGLEYRRKWQQKCPELYKAHDWIRYEMQQKKKLRPPPGMLLNYPQPDLQGLNACGSTPAAVKLYTSCILIDEQIKARQMRNTRIMFTVHDSIVMNVGNARKDPTVLKTLHDEIVHPVLTRPTPWLNGFVYGHSASVGTMWDWEMEDYKKWKETV